MTWFKIDDGFHCHPKVLTAGNAATGLYVRLGSWCSQQLTDGQIPAEVATVYGRPAEIRSLVDSGLLEQTESGYRIRDYLDYNPSRQDVLTEREKKVRAGRSGGSWGNHLRWHGENPSSDCRFCIGTSSAEASADDRQVPMVVPMVVPIEASAERSAPADNMPRECRSANDRSRPDPTRTTDIPTGLLTPEPVENPRLEEITLAYLNAERSRANGQIRNPTNWETTVRNNFTTKHATTITRWLETFDPPTDVIIGALQTGDTRNLAYYPKDTGPDADIIELHPTGTDDADQPF
jgi:hypothetical protein